MNVLYIIGDDTDGNDYQSLRYSLRGIAKHGINVSGVYVVGDVPQWLNTEEVRTLPCKYDDLPKQENIYAKVMYAISSGFMPQEEFLTSSDDHFHIKDTDFANYPRFYKAEPHTLLHDEQWYCANHGLKKGDLNWYFRSMVDTRKILEREGLPIFNTDLHLNRHVNPIYAQEVASLHDNGISLDLGHQGFEVNVLFNALAIHHNPNLVYRPFVDVKIYNTKVLDKIDDEDFVFSCSHMVSFDKNFWAWMSRRFPEKCKYEK